MIIIVQSFIDFGLLCCLHCFVTTCLYDYLLVTSDVYFFFSSLISGQRQCKPCPPNTYAMLAASKCLPLPNCTTDDIVDAPGDLNTCLCTSQSDIHCNTTVHPYFVTVQGELNEILCRVTFLEIMENCHACKSQCDNRSFFKAELLS